MMKNVYLAIAIVLGIGLLYWLWKQGVFERQPVTVNVTMPPYLESTFGPEAKPTVTEVKTTIQESVKKMTEHGEKVGVTFTQPYTEESLTAQALRYERLATAYGR